MRYYLDTNILIYFLFEKESITDDVYNLIDDPSSFLYVSAVAVQEIVHLYKLKKIYARGFQTASDIVKTIEEVGIIIKPLNKHHLLQYALLETEADHKDPTDHIIIAQAMADKIPIISTDRKFKKYVKQGLDFIFNGK